MSAPIKLGSAATGSRLVFETGSTITTSDSGIQQASIKALCYDGANVLSFVPAAGVTFNSVFGNSYLPADFKVDLTGGGAAVEYLAGNAARVTITFKRPDPALIGDASRKIFPDTTVRYVDNIILTGSLFQLPFQSQTGLPEPTVTVRYNSTTQPTLERAYFALPGSLPVIDFPTVPAEIVVKAFFWSDNTYSDFSFFDQTWVPTPAGWRLQEIKSDPVAGASFWDVTEVWRMNYVFKPSGIVFITHG